MGGGVGVWVIMVGSVVSILLQFESLILNFSIYYFYLFLFLFCLTSLYVCLILVIRVAVLQERANQIFVG